MIILKFRFNLIRLLSHLAFHTIHAEKIYEILADELVGFHVT